VDERTDPAIRRPKPERAAGQEGRLMKTTTWVAKLVLPVSPARDHMRGGDHAQVTLVEYGDYECLFCGAAHQAVNAVQAHLGERLCFVFRHFPLTTLHPHAQQAAEAAEAAGAQQMFWPMHSTLLENQQYLSDAYLMGYAKALRLNVAVFQEDLLNHAHLPRIREDFLSGVRSGVQGTPTFYINGIRHDGSWEFPELLAAVERSAAEQPVKA
jgi:protein-disulfide isomerase